MVNTFPTGGQEGVAGLAHFGDRLFVICWKSSTIQLFHDQDPFHKLEEEIQIPGMVDPYDMCSNITCQSIFVSDYKGKGIWRIDMSNRAIRKTGLRVKPRGLSITPWDMIILATWCRDEQSRKRTCHLDFFTTPDVTLNSANRIRVKISVDSYR